MSLIAVLATVAGIAAGTLDLQRRSPSFSLEDRVFSRLHFPAHEGSEALATAGAPYTL